MSGARFSYHKLKQDHRDDNHHVSASAVEAALEATRGVMRARAWSRLRRVPVQRRLRVRGFRVIKLRRYLMSRKVRLVKKVKGSWEKVVRRVKESQAHFGDLFAGNYLLLQVNPTPLKGAGWSYEGGRGGAGGRLGLAEDLRNPMYNNMLPGRVQQFV